MNRSRSTAAIIILTQCWKLLNFLEVLLLQHSGFRQVRKSVAAASVLLKYMLLSPIKLLSVSLIYHMTQTHSVITIMSQKILVQFFGPILKWQTQMAEQLIISHTHISLKMYSFEFIIIPSL